MELLLLHKIEGLGKSFGSLGTDQAFMLILLWRNSEGKRHLSLSERKESR